MYQQMYFERDVVKFLTPTDLLEPALLGRLIK
jgi:hypothetical protein